MSTSSPSPSPTPTPMQRLKNKLKEIGICPKCLKEYVFENDKPVYSCDCRTGEWGDSRPTLYTLRHELQVYKVAQVEVRQRLEKLFTSLSDLVKESVLYREKELL